LWKAFKKFAIEQFDNVEIGDALNNPNEKTLELIAA